jgi:hypothetical protein
MAIIATSVVVGGIACAIASAVRLLRIGAREAGDLAGKLAIPFPRCAADWPELRLDAVVPDPERAKRVLLLARWPADPDRSALLVVDVDGAATRGQRLLMHWRDSDASLAPVLIARDRLLLRRRRARDTVIAIVILSTSG